MGFGTPMKNSPAPMITPNAEFKSELSQKVSAQPLCGVVQRHRRSVKVGRTEQPDHRSRRSSFCSSTNTGTRGQFLVLRTATV